MSFRGQMDDDLTTWQIYRRDSLAHDLLAYDEEQHLLSLACRGDAAAIERLVEMNQRLVVSVAKRYINSGMAGDQALLDLVQHGNLGLLEAIRRWDAGRRTRFSTYASWWIRATVRRGAITQGSSLPPTARHGELMSIVRRAVAVLQPKLGRLPTVAEISAHTCISTALVRTVLPLFRRPLSLDAEPPETGRSLVDVLRDDDIGPEQAAEASLDVERLYAALNRLPERLKRLLILRYGLERPPFTYSQIAALMGISRQRIYDLEHVALEKLKRILID